VNCPGQVCTFQWAPSSGPPDGYLLYATADNGRDWVGISTDPIAEVPCLATPYQEVLQRLHVLPYSVRPGSDDEDRSFITSIDQWAESSDEVICLPEPVGLLSACLVLLAMLAWGRRGRS
jgi:hypothetical protein